MIIQKTVILGGGKDGMQNVFVRETIISREFQRRSHPRVEGNILVLYCDFAPFNLGVPGSSLVVIMSFPRFFHSKNMYIFHLLFLQDGPYSHCRGITNMITKSKSEMAV